jgi:hypothetical protein
MSGSAWSYRRFRRGGVGLFSWYPAARWCDIGITVGTSAMDEIEAFLGECRADPWFQNHPAVVDRLKGVLNPTQRMKAPNGGPGTRFWRFLKGQPTRLSTGARLSPWCSRAWMDRQLSWKNRPCRFPAPWPPEMYPAAMSSATPPGRRSPVATVGRPGLMLARRTSRDESPSTLRGMALGVPPQGPPIICRVLHGPPKPRALVARSMGRTPRRRGFYSALTDCTVQFVGTLPINAVDEIVAPFMNHIAVLPLVSRQSRSLMPSPL